jgi:AraC family transcriptional regulator
MDRMNLKMDKIVRPHPAGLLSKQVTGGRYFFLNLAPGPAEPLALVMGGRESCNPDYVISRRDFPFYAIEYVVSGRGSVVLDGRTHDLVPGAVFAYAPTTRCEIHTDPKDPMVKYFLTLAGRGDWPRTPRSRPCWRISCGKGAGPALWPGASAACCSNSCS